MNSNHTPNLQPNGDEQGDHPEVDAAGSNPVPEAECIRLPTAPWQPYPRSQEVLIGIDHARMDSGRQFGPGYRIPGCVWLKDYRYIPVQQLARDQGRYGREPSAGPLINDAAEITVAQWNELLAPFADLPPNLCWTELQERIIACIAKEKAGKIMPLCWDRIIAIRDREWQEMCKENYGVRGHSADLAADPKVPQRGTVQLVSLEMTEEEVQRRAESAVAGSGIMIPDPGMTGAQTLIAAELDHANLAAEFEDHTSETEVPEGDEEGPRMIEHPAGDYWDFGEGAGEFGDQEKDPGTLTQPGADFE